MLTKYNLRLQRQSCLKKFVNGSLSIDPQLKKCSPHPLLTLHPGVVFILKYIRDKTIMQWSTKRRIVERQTGDSPFPYYITLFFEGPDLHVKSHRNQGRRGVCSQGADVGGADDSECCYNRPLRL